MALTITWQGGDEATVVNSTYYVGFFGTNFGDSISLGSFNNTTVATDVNGGINHGALPNVKYVGSTTANWGEGVENLSSIENTECTLKITASSGSGFNIQALKLIAYNGTDESVAPSNVVIYGAEKGDSSWTLMSGSAQPLILTPASSSSPPNSYHYYIALSATPSVAGTNTSIALKFYAEHY